MPPLPLMPPGGLHTLQQNMHEAKFHGQLSNMPSLYVYHWFYLKVKNRGPWDYKQKHRSYANFGNFNYGATGFAAGIPVSILLRAAGFAQNRAKTSEKDWGEWHSKAPYGDDPEDQKWILRGIDYAKSQSF